MTTMALGTGSPERLLTIERADADLDAWLKDQRKRTKIEYLDKDLAP